MHRTQHFVVKIGKKILAVLHLVRLTTILKQTGKAFWNMLGRMQHFYHNKKSTLCAKGQFFCRMSDVRLLINFVQVLQIYTENYHKFIKHIACVIFDSKLFLQRVWSVFSFQTPLPAEFVCICASIALDFNKSRDDSWSFYAKILRV